MEHPCYRCQAEIQESLAFCPHCGAPQIRVIQPEGLESSDVPAPSAENVRDSLPAQRASAPAAPVWTQSTPPSAPAPGAIHWERAWKGALFCGIGAAALTAIPIVSMGCCLWMLGAGALTVLLYQRGMPGTFLTPGMGMRVGALAGAFGFVVHAIVATASFVGLRSSGEFNRAMQEQMQKQMARNPDPKVQEMMQRMLGWVSTPQGAATMMVLVLMVLAVVFVLITAAGGALGASMLGRRREFR